MTGAEVFGAVFGAASARSALSLLLTYGIHGAIAGGAVSVLIPIARLSAAGEHRLWKMALFAPPLSALLAARAPGDAMLPGALVVFRVPEAPAVAAAIAPSFVDAATSAVALIVALGIAAGVGRFAIGFARVRRSLRDRRSPDPRLALSMARVAGRFALGPVELTESAHLASPTAFAARAICFPARRLGLLADAEIDAVLAHELAHLERRDPIWFFLAGLVQGALWMQPLNHRVAARLRRSAEIACDDRAIAVTGDALGLARALSRFAHDAFDAAHASLPGATRTPGALVERVGRLVGAAAGQPRESSRALATRSGAATWLLAAVAVGCVGVSVAFARGLVVAALPGTATAGFDVAAASRRAADLVSAELRLEAQIDAARARMHGDPSDLAASTRVLELEQDLRHAREEYAWLERIVADRIER